MIDGSLFLDEWKNQMIESINRINPDWNDDDINKVLNKMINKQMTNPLTTMDNNYTGERKDASLLSVLDWVIKRKPNIAGNGTFYKNQHEALNPVATMLDNILKTRKALKKQMFMVEDKDSDEYKDLDRGQQNEKISVNSYYGASGAPSSAFYSLWSGPATTITAQSVISTTETTFEAFLVDNFKFTDINECFAWMNTILNQDYELDDWILRVSIYDVFDRIKSLFISYSSSYDEVIYRYLSNLSVDELTKIYYKNQLLEFTESHTKVKRVLRNIFEAVENVPDVSNASEIDRKYSSVIKDAKDDKDALKKYISYKNHEAFLDPNSPPDTIIKLLEKLNSYYMKYVYVPFLQIDRIHRLKYFKRKTVAIVDTDSNILSLDFWVNYCNDHILESDYGRDKEHNIFIMVNTLTYTITSVVKDILEVYGEHSNIPEDFRSKFNMKNEFYFTKLVIGNKKKRYLSAIKLREGNLFPNIKPDCKGFDYMKAKNSDEAKAFFDGLVKKYILTTEVPDVSGILGELKKFEDHIIESIRNSERTYLPIENAKEIAAYKFPYREQGVRGVIGWNLLYPNNNIEFPSKVSILKLKIFKPEDIKDLEKTHPREYNIIIEDIFGNREPEIAKKGLQVIAIPSNSTIPEWLMDYIDYDAMVNTIVGQFKGVLDIFGCGNAEVGKCINGCNRKTNKFSNIVYF